MGQNHSVKMALESTKACPVIHKGMFLLACMLIIMALSEPALVYRGVTKSVPSPTSAEETDITRTKLADSNPEIISERLIPVMKGIRNSSDVRCKPSNRVVFLKTHKTAGTTVAGIFANYAYNHDLNVAYAKHGPTFQAKKPFARELVGKTRTNGTKWDRKSDGFDILYSHARYNRPELEAVVPRSKFITVVREPVAQFVSAFHYYGFDRHFNTDSNATEGPIDVFFRNPTRSLESVKERYTSHVLHNHQLFDLGLEPQYFTDHLQINAIIRKLDKEFNLVLINEYLDASLVLMRKVLCWNISDLFYHSEKIVQHKTNLLPATIAKIKQWNMADYKLYDHFNKTFWRRISEYGNGFAHDLWSFQKQNENHTFRFRNLYITLKPGIISKMAERGIIYTDS